MGGGAWLLWVLPARADPTERALRGLAAEVRRELDRDLRHRKAVLSLLEDTPHPAQVGEGEWVLRRNPEGETAIAFAGHGATLESLGRFAGLDPALTLPWLTFPPDRRLKLSLPEPVYISDLTAVPSDALAPGEAVRVPNTVVALWLGSLGQAGRRAVGWPGDLAYLRERGFYVEEIHGPEERGDGQDKARVRSFRVALLARLKALAERKALHGLFIWSHGYLDGIYLRGYPILYYEEDQPNWFKYKLAIVIVNACQGGKGICLASSPGKFYGIHMRLIPLLDGARVADVLKPGEQGTR